MTPATELQVVPKEEPLESALEVLTPVLRGDDLSKQLIAAKCIGLMSGYDARWRNAPFRIDAVESVVSSDLYNPATKARSRTFTVSGKIDVHATEISTGAHVIFDHKTTSQEIADPNAPYWRQLVIEGQVSHYFLLEWLNEVKVDYAMWDAVRKPGIAPKMLAKKEQQSVMMFGQYCNAQLTGEQLEEFAASEAGRETPLMYAYRLAYDCTTERPEWYFQRRQVPRLDSEVLEYAGELWDHSQDLIVVRRTGRNPRNSGACMTYNSPCKFLAICSGYDSPDSEQWTRKSWVHPELPILQGDGKEILTNSRIRTFQTCRRKHQLQYDIGIEKIEEEEKESLYFGQLLHSALEQYFIALMELQKHGA